jgi:hypothetical protein
MNKYRAGGRCSGDSSMSQSNTTFSKEYSDMMNKRSQLDMLFKSQPTATKVTELAVISKTISHDKKRDIDFILEGDMN